MGRSPPVSTLTATLCPCTTFFRSTETGGPRHALVRYCVLPDALAYDPARVRDKFAAARADALAHGTTLVLSHERLSGYPSSGGHDRRMIADRQIGRAHV